jgi:protoheme IX farnesyltransferase
MLSLAQPASLLATLRQFHALTKPRVVALIVFCAVIGMFLATPGMVPLPLLLSATLGIWMVAGAAAAMNCLVEQKIDARMARTKGRPLPSGLLNPGQTLGFAILIGGVGLWLLHQQVNPLTMWLTLATFVGYAVIYTVILKPLTPQNIVIGGLSGAMPPLLGWTAVTGEVAPEALLLVLIIFAWTPPHFWALALFRSDDYARAGIPMLPVVAGPDATRLQILLYTVLLAPLGLAPWLLGFAGPAYAVVAGLLGLVFLYYAITVWRDPQDATGRSLTNDVPARRTFRFSLLYLALLFAALAAEHLVLR